MKLGIVGAGKIVLDFFEAIENIGDIELIAIMATSRNLENLKFLQQKHKIKNIYTDIDEFLKDDFDVVYMAVPNHLHFDMTKKILEHGYGKHVFLEKPFASNYNEAKELIEIANKKNLILFEAISNQYLPNYLKTKELLDELGDIKIVQINFSQYSSRYDEFKNGIIHSVFDPKKSGGVLVDLNVYCIYFIVGLFGEPKNISYFANVEKGIDTSGILILEYDSFKAVAIASKDSDGLVSIGIQGEKGQIKSLEKANLYDSFVLKLNGSSENKFELNKNKHRLYYEIIEFLKIYETKDFEKAKKSNKKTLQVMKILDEARKQVGIKIC